MSEKKTFPRVVISAPKSGSGKTLITCAVLRLLERKGYKPASFKCGPDYIDPMFHKTVLRIPSRNLDLFLMGKDGVKTVLSKGSHGRDIGIIEGVMGYYDGMSATSMEGSSYDLSRLTESPTILVIDCKGMSRSILPMIKGFCDYDTGKTDDHLTGKRNNIQGLILNNISDRLSDELSELILKETGIPVIGHLPALKDIEIGSRHLGLVMPSEIPGILSVIYRFTDELEERFDFDRFMKIANSASDIEENESFYREDTKKKVVKIGVARDEAFCFYYEDNLDLLKEMGAELVNFSLIHDSVLPDVSGLILGGGYPELYAKELSANTKMLQSIKNAAESGMPMLAECGGYLFLKDRLSDPEGITYEMAGVLEGDAYMTESLSHFGYVNVSAKEDNPYLESGKIIKAHEYHYCDTTDNGSICDVKKPTGNRSWTGYQVSQNVFGGFAHLYYPSCQSFIDRFLEAAALA